MEAALRHVITVRIHFALGGESTLPPRNPDAIEIDANRLESGLPLQLVQEGAIRGGGNLLARWRESNARLPNLFYQEVGITADARRVIIEYVRHAPDQDPMPVAEAFDISGGKIAASRVYHG